jgi:hypothetical protein
MFAEEKRFMMFLCGNILPRLKSKRKPGIYLMSFRMILKG